MAFLEKHRPHHTYYFLPLFTAQYRREYFPSYSLARFTRFFAFRSGQNTKPLSEAVGSTKYTLDTSFTVLRRTIGMKHEAERFLVLSLSLPLCMFIRARVFLVLSRAPDRFKPSDVRRVRMGDGLGLNCNCRKLKLQNWDKCEFSSSTQSGGASRQQQVTFDTLTSGKVVNCRGKASREKERAPA